MLTNQDRAEIMKMLGKVKMELRKEFWRDTNDGFEDRQVIKGAVSEVENALCDIDFTTDERMADIENALCEIDEGE